MPCYVRHYLHVINKEIKDHTEQKKLTTGFLFRALKKVQVGKAQEKAQSEKDSHSKNRGGKKPN